MRNVNNLIGETFGKLTVIQKRDELEDRYCTWLCKCECGGEIVVNTKRLKRGTITDCGCEPKNPNLRGNISMDIKGQRFGRLVTLEKMPRGTKKDRTSWLCQCDCGNTLVVTTHQLCQGKTKSCGCISTERRKNSAVDISGKTFGRLTAICPTEKRDKKGSIFWHCHCECGNELDITEDCLVHGHYRSCGCLKEEIKTVINTRLTFVESTCIEWLKFRKSRIDNTSGFRGVYLNKNNTWRASIGLQNKSYYLGAYKSFDDAVRARLRIEEALHDGFIETYSTWLDKAEEDEAWAEKNPFYFNVHKKSGSFYISTPFSDTQVDIP